MQRDKAGKVSRDQVRQTERGGPKGTGWRIHRVGGDTARRLDVTGILNPGPTSTGRSERALGCTRPIVLSLPRSGSGISIPHRWAEQWGGWGELGLTSTWSPFWQHRPPSVPWVSPGHATCCPSSPITESPSRIPITWYLSPNEVCSLSNPRATIWPKPTLHFHIPVKVTLSTLDQTAWWLSLLMKCCGD